MRPRIMRASELLPMYSTDSGDYYLCLRTDVGPVRLSDDLPHQAAKALQIALCHEITKFCNREIRRGGT